MKQKLYKFIIFSFIYYFSSLNASEFVTITQPANGSTIRNNQPTISGTTNPGLEVLLTVRNSADQDVFTASVPSDATTGIWSRSIAPTVLPNGVYSIIATTPDASANSTFTVDAAQCTLPADLLTLALREKYLVPD